MDGERGYSVDVVSPQFPCGAAWLANALLELDLSMWHLWGVDTRAEWQATANGSYRYVAEKQPWRQTLASLELGREYPFRDDIRPRYTHAFPWQLDRAAKTVLVVRDPRDALYSEWQRHRRILQLQLPFVDFLRGPFLQGPISVVDMLWLHLRCWLEPDPTGNARPRLVRFEDCKQAPQATLRSLSDWLSLPASAAAIEHAIHASGVQRLIAIEQALADIDPATPRYNRLGQAEEWRETWQPEWDAALGAHWQPLLAQLGYAPLAAAGPVRPTFDVDTVLAWRDLRFGPRARHWSERITDWCGQVAG